MADLARLAPEEFPTLKTVADGYMPDPRKSIVVLAKDGSEAIGRIMLLAPAHIEGTWVADRARKGLVLRQLVGAIELEAAAEGIKELFAYSPNEQVGDYLERLGYVKMPLTIYAKELTTCPSPR